MTQNRTWIALAVLAIAVGVYAASPVEQVADANRARGVGPRSLPEAGARILTLESRVSALEERLAHAEALLRNSPNLQAMERGVRDEADAAIRRRNERAAELAEENNRQMRELQEDNIRRREMQLDQERNDLLRRQLNEQRQDRLDRQIP